VDSAKERTTLRLFLLSSLFINGGEKIDERRKKLNLIEISNLQINRNEHIALGISNLSIQRGETLTVVGPNGAGKSTLLLALARLLRPSHGDIIYDGKSLKQWDELEYRRRISFVFQSPLLMDMTVEQNVALGLTFRGIPKEETRERVGKWMKQLGVDTLSKRRAGQLSGGEAQRVSLARAFVLEPELLLLDEPFAALDPPTHAKLLDDLSGLLKQDHRTAVFVTHNLNEATKLSHRIAVIVAGILRQVGTAKQIKSKPSDETVAAFLDELPQ
jgi:tungstate transport system ATP-binding protein